MSGSSSQAAFPALREGRRPSIVLFSSVAAETGLPGQAAYAAAKGRRPRADQIARHRMVRGRHPGQRPWSPVSQVGLHH
jgi:NADP-dependent 3-hydroxy acid dehydrogenase YdfG